MKFTITVPDAEASLINGFAGCEGKSPEHWILAALQPTLEAYVKDVAVDVTRTSIPAVQPAGPSDAADTEEVVFRMRRDQAALLRGFAAYYEKSVNDWLEEWVEQGLRADAEGVAGDLMNSEQARRAESATSKEASS